MGHKVPETELCITASYNWASETSPTLGCSIEISGDIYMSVGGSVGRYVCREPKCVGGITCAHAQKSFLGGKN